MRSAYPYVPVAIQLTAHTVKLRPSSKADNRSAGQEMSNLLSSAHLRMGVRGSIAG
jgi:hypothetical protein